MALANFIGFYFNLLLENVHVVSEISASEVFEQIMRVSEGGCFYRHQLSALFPPHHQSDAVRAGHGGEGDRLDRCGGVSHRADRQHFALYARSDMVSFLDSLVAPLSLINALIVATSAKTQGDLSSNFERLEKIWAEYEVY